MRVIRYSYSCSFGSQKWHASFSTLRGPEIFISEMENTVRLSIVLSKSRIFYTYEKNTLSTFWCVKNMKNTRFAQNNTL